MSPIEAIVSWLEAQDLDLQLDIASFGSFLIFEDGDDPSLSMRERLEALRKWLNEPELDSEAAATRALTFRISIDYFIEGRSTGHGWKQIEAKLRKTLEEAKRVGKFSAARKAQRMLELLPARQERWHEVARSWNELASTRLNLEALTDWSDKRSRLKVISSAETPPLVPIASAFDVPINEGSSPHGTEEC
ncbi:hypothetical protein NLM33_35170 [Bradyrhizobium sp. CCGUVB1N3]|uniref:hypothetical protein n=1 Tax=Bradyrhizobium sp. CCGUVB1N3 TaxID=2949629 RepID=UPI0020B3160E|nr:hypothetical protein [Bradyrhizobium sp. CCGUVB1N3]MCP3475532.1 hypothetical protein [Bradyrhizobium sp. CCGUVB1N3]